MGIYPKVNVIARLEYELAYYDSAVHRFNYYTTGTPTFCNFERCIINEINKHTEVRWLFMIFCQSLTLADGNMNMTDFM